MPNEQIMAYQNWIEEMRGHMPGWHEQYNQATTADRRTNRYVRRVKAIKEDNQFLFESLVNEFVEQDEDCDVRYYYEGGYFAAIIEYRGIVLEEQEEPPVLTPNRGVVDAYQQLIANARQAMHPERDPEVYAEATANIPQGRTANTHNAHNYTPAEREWLNEQGVADLVAGQAALDDTADAIPQGEDDEEDEAPNQPIGRVF